MVNYVHGVYVQVVVSDCVRNVVVVDRFRLTGRPCALYVAIESPLCSV